MLKAALVGLLAVVGLHGASPGHPSLDGKVVCGYQGWFRADGDASGLGWVHYGPGQRLAPGTCSFDLWPDLSEYTPAERYASPFKFADGQSAPLFSSVHPLTVRRHFRWMKEYGIDGAMVQRFATGLGHGRGSAAMDLVLRHCNEAATAEGRSLTVMYDLSGLKPEKFAVVAEDWKKLIAAGQIKQPCYQHHAGKFMALASTRMVARRMVWARMGPASSRSRAQQDRRKAPLRCCSASAGAVRPEPPSIISIKHSRHLPCWRQEEGT